MLLPPMTMFKRFLVASFALVACDFPLPDLDTSGGDSDPVEPDSEWTTGIVDVPADGAFLSTVEDVRTGQHADFERLVFEFDEGIPGYHIEYIDQPAFQCGSGDPVWLAGDGWLEIRLEPAAMHTEDGEATIDDRDRLLNWPNFKQLTSTCDFEATVTWVLGVGSPNPYRVFELQDPPRLVIDVKK